MHLQLDIRSQTAPDWAQCFSSGVPNPAPGDLLSSKVQLQL